MNFYINADSINDILRETRLDAEIEIDSIKSIIHVQTAINGEKYALHAMTSPNLEWEMALALIGRCIGGAIIQQYKQTHTKEMDSNV